MKKIVTTFLISLILCVGLMVPLKANAILGVADISWDPPQQITQTLGITGDWARFSIKKGLKTALANLQKRLIDKLKNQTVKWIQGEGKPKFVKDPGNFIEDATNEAAGQTIKQLGAGELCRSSQFFKLRLQLQKQETFSESVSCTLDDVVGNINEFAQDFSEGGWIAYSQAIKPQNNSLGLEFMAQSKLLAKKGEKKTRTKREISKSGGCLGVKICSRWEPINLSPGEAQLPPRTAPEFENKVPDTGDNWIGKTKWPKGSDYYCAEVITATPGSTVKNTLNKALGSDYKYLANTDAIGGAINAIINAAVNRLTKEATEGLINIATENQDQGNCNNLTGETREACQSYQSKEEEAVDRSESATTTAQNRREDAQNRKNENPSNINSIEDCEQFLPEGEPPSLRDRMKYKQCRNTFDQGEQGPKPSIKSNEGHSITVGLPHTHSETKVSDPQGNLNTYDWELIECPGTCPAINSNSEGEVSGNPGEGESVDLPDPTYTPDEAGEYKLKLTVTDEDENQATDVVTEGGNNKPSIYNLEPRTIFESNNDPFTHEGAESSDEDGDLKNYAWNLTSCPAECPSIENNKSGSISGAPGERIDLPAPSFDATDSGEYVLELTIKDEAGHTVRKSVTDTTDFDG